MSQARKTLILILLGCVAVALAVIVLVRNRSFDDEVLATLGLVGGVAIVVNSLPSTKERS
jgi:hypothetical protein